MSLAPARAAAALAPTLAALLAVGPAAASLTGVCPDGSMFIVKRADLIPCRDAKLVEPNDMPPIRPQFLPRPYAWEVFNQQQDPNNPYNLIDAARKVRDAKQAGTPPVGAGPPQPAPPIEPPPPQQQAGPQTALVRPGPQPQPAPLLALSDQEIRDLFLIVELSQRRAPAVFSAGAGDGVTLRFAHSAAFEPVLRDARTHAGETPIGPVVLFSVVADAIAPFYGNLTFVQGHVAYQPDTSDPNQLGLLRGHLGTLTTDDPVLGYVVLPEHLDPSQPMDIYWNDRRLTATLKP